MLPNVTSKLTRATTTKITRSITTRVRSSPRSIEKSIENNENMKKISKKSQKFHKFPQIFNFFGLFTRSQTKFQNYSKNIIQNHYISIKSTQTTNNIAQVPKNLHELNILAKNEAKQCQETTTQNKKFLNKIEKKIETFQNLHLYKLFMNISRRHALRSITVAASADELGKIRQMPRDWSMDSTELQKYHDQLVKKSLPFTNSVDIELLLKPEVTWSSDSLIGLLKQVVMAPWDTMLYLYDLCRKVYLRFTKKTDSSLLPWIYQLLDVKVPLEDLIFDINQFSPEEHQLYLLITSILRYQLVLEIALSNAIAQAPFPRQFVTQLEDSAQKAGLSEDDFKKQLRLSQQQFQKQKQLALQQLKLAALPNEFYPDEQIVELLEAVSIPKDLPIEELITQPELVLDFIRNHLTDQLAQIQLPQIPALLEFKGLSSAVRHLSPPQHFAIYQSLLKTTTTPDHSIRRSIRQMAIKGTPKDFDTIRETVTKQLQHMRRVIKTYQRQQTQLQNFGYIVKRKKNFNKNSLRNMSKMDQAMYLQDLEEGIFLTIDDIDPEEEAEGSLIGDEELTIPARYRTTNQGKRRNNDDLNRRRDKRNQEKAKNMPRLNENDMKITLRMMSMMQEAQENGLNEEEIGQIDMNDNTQDEELLSNALDQFNGSVVELEQFLRPIYYDIKRSQEGEGDLDEYYGTDDYDDDNGDDGLDPLHDEDYDDDKYLNENLVPMRNRDRDTETDEERTRRDKIEEDDKNRRSNRSERYKNEVSNRKDQKDSKNKQKEKFLDLPAHVIRDPNPKIVSERWYRDAMENYSVFQDRLARVERLVMEKDFAQRQKYISAARYFSQPLIPEVEQRENANILQRELGKHVVKMFETLPQEYKNLFFERRHEAMERQKANEERRKQQRERFEKDRAERALKMKDNQGKNIENNQTTDEMKQNSQNSLILSSQTPETVLNQSETTSNGINMVDNVIHTPTGDVTLGQNVKIEPIQHSEGQSDEEITLNSILSATNPDTTASTMDTTTIDPQNTQKTDKNNQNGEKIMKNSAEDRDEKGQKPGISYKFEAAKTIQEESVQWEEMMVAVQEFQRNAHAQQYMSEQMQVAFERAQRRVMDENSDILAQLQKLEDENGPMTQEELDTNPDLNALQSKIDAIDVKPTQLMRRRAMERAEQNVELPLSEQMQLIRMRGLSNVELHNSEMADIMYDSVRDLLQTALYDSSNNNLIENSISNLLLSVLSGKKSVESYDSMAKFNHEIEDELNRTRFSVKKLTSMHRKYILMQLQQEHNLNKSLPLGELPKVLSFLGETNDARKLIEHERQFLGQDDDNINEKKKNLYPKSTFSLEEMRIKTKKIPTYDDFYHRYKTAVDTGVSISQVNMSKLYQNEVQLQEEAGEYILSEQFDKIITSPQEIQFDIFDSRWEIVSSKHLLKQLTRVRDRRLRELLQMIHMIGADHQTIAETTKYHIKTLSPALDITSLPEPLVVYMTKFHTHRSIAATLNALVKELSSKRKAVVDRVLDFSRDEYDITLQYCMDLLQYHNMQLQAKVPDIYGTQFKAIDLQRTGFKKFPDVWRPELLRPLSIKDLISAAEIYDV